MLITVMIIFSGQATVYPSWTPGKPVYAATSASSGYRQYGKQVTSSQFGHHVAPFVGASGYSVNTEATRNLFSNDNKVKQDGKSFHLPKLVLVNGPMTDG
jgi:hypothetical protein